MLIIMDPARSSLSSNPHFDAQVLAQAPIDISTTPKDYGGKILESRLIDEAFAQHITDPISFLNILLKETVILNASDILFEPELDTVRTRARIDGVLYLLGQFPRSHYASIIARIKILSKLDTTERRRAQEGQFTFEFDEVKTNMRVEIVQAVHDELVVIRVLQLTNVVMELSDLGFSPNAYQTFTEILDNRAGLVLVAGPTGSGKTTTLYSTIHYLNKNQEFNIVTIEDPVEYQLAGVNQMPVRVDEGFTFEEGLRVTLRLSPDIVLVGEIRDRQTAMIAVESGLTGHMILSTIHTPDAVGVIYRLLDLGIESYFLNASLRGVIAQRLVRKICTDCAHQYEPGEDEVNLFRKYLGRSPHFIARSQGCLACQQMGYRGRIGIYEVLKIDSSIRKLIRDRVNEDLLRSHLVEQAFITLMKDGLLKAEAGLTTVDEVLRNSLRID
jgi:type IV pilus assembly protein PilB